MLTKLQIAFCVVAGLGIIVFGVGMVSNVNVAKVPTWLAPVAWGSFGAIMASCVGVVATLALDRDKPPASEEEEEAEEEESELLPVEESTDETVGETVGEPGADVDETASDLVTVETTETAPSAEPQAFDEEPMEFVEPGSAETIDFSTLSEDENE